LHQLAKITGRDPISFPCSEFKFGAVSGMKAARYAFDKGRDRKRAPDAQVRCNRKDGPR
jgi:hypothetical protein